MSKTSGSVVLDQESTAALAALKRARRRAEEIAARTGTAIVLAVGGAPVRVMPSLDAYKASRQP
jgi:polysaccharide deacetylase 2 family uncharacterized protein YibQ